MPNELVTPSDHLLERLEGRCLASIIRDSECDPIPAFARGQVPGNLREAISRAIAAWLLRTPSSHTRKAYEHDLSQFFAHAGIAADAYEHLPQVRPEHVSKWRDRLAAGGMTNSSIRRKLTTLRSLFSYL